VNISFVRNIVMFSLALRQSLDGTIAL